MKVAATASTASTLLAVVLGVCGCTQPELANQPKYKPLGEAPVWPNDQAARVPPAGTVAHDADVGATPTKMPYPMTRALLERGRQRFEIYCSPCHDSLGTGNGIIVRHGFPAPATYHSAGLRAVPLSYFYNIITNGIGPMYSYADRVPPKDRWSIAAYIRALQMSQHTNVDSLTPAQRARLEPAPEPAR